MTQPDITAQRAELEQAVAAARGRAPRGAAPSAGSPQPRGPAARTARHQAHRRVRLGRQVKAKTEAAKLFAQLQTAENPPVAWERREQDAATKVTTAQRGLGWFMQTNVADLVKAREPDDIAINTRIIDAATEFIDAVVAKNKFEGRSRSCSCRRRASTPSPRSSTRTSSASSASSSRG